MKIKCFAVFCGSKSGKDSISYRHDLDTEEMVRLFKEGISSKQIAKQMGCWDSSVRYRLKTVGIEFPEKRFVPDPTLDTNEMIELYKEGLTLKQIGERLNCTGAAVRYRLIRTGMKLRPSNNIPRTKAA